MNFLIGVCLALLLPCGLFAAPADIKKPIYADTIEMFENTMNDDYSRNKILLHYKSTCVWQNKMDYVNCLREAAAVWNVTTGVKETDNVHNVCCFFMNALECAKSHVACKPMYFEMFRYYIKTELKNQCKSYDYESVNIFNECPVSTQRKNEVSYQRLSKSEEPFLYNLGKEFKLTIRKVTGKR